MSRVKIRVRKTNPAGELLHEYVGEELHRDDHSVVLEALFTRDDMPFQDVVFKKGDRFVEYFYSDRWYNIFAVYDRDDRRIKGWYCNVGMPALIDGDVVSYIDLALDLWVTADGRQVVLDEDEFDAMNLDADLVNSARRGLLELQHRFLNDGPPDQPGGPSS